MTYNLDIYLVITSGISMQLEIELCIVPGHMLLQLVYPIMNFNSFGIRLRTRTCTREKSGRSWKHLVFQFIMEFDFVSCLDTLV